MNIIFVKCNGESWRSPHTGLLHYVFTDYKGVKYVSCRVHKGTWYVLNYNEDGIIEDSLVEDDVQVVATYIK